MVVVKVTREGLTQSRGFEIKIYFSWVFTCSSNEMVTAVVSYGSITSFSRKFCPKVLIVVSFLLNQTFHSLGTEQLFCTFLTVLASRPLVWYILFLTNLTVTLCTTEGSRLFKPQL